MTDRVTLHESGGIADVRLARPDKHNALDGAMFEQIAAAIDRLGSMAGLRVVVLSGEGPSFCAGLDVQSFSGGPEGVEALLERDEDGLNLAQRVCVGWQRLDVPVIAAVQGKAYGGGLQIALGADIRVFAPDAELSVMEIRWGIIPDMGITQTLLPLVSMDAAKELTFTGRTVDAGEAVRLGLGSGIAEQPYEAAMELAAEIVQRSPDAVRAAKRLFNESWKAPVQEALELETALQRELLFSPNQIEAVMANIEGRKPDWR